MIYRDNVKRYYAPFPGRQKAREHTFVTPMQRARVGPRHEAPRLLPLQTTETEATREAAKATRRRQEAEKQYAKLVNEGKNRTAYVVARRGEIDRALEKPENQSGARRQELVLERDRLLKESQAGEQTRRVAAERVTRAKVEEAGARRAAKVASANVREGRADVQATRAETAAGSARRLAGLGVAGRAEGEIFLRMLQQNPQLATLDPSFAEKAARIDPEYVNKLMEQQGEKLPEYQRFAREQLPSFPLGEGVGIEDTRKGATRERDKAEADRLAAEQEEARTVAESGRQLGQTVNEAMASALQAAIDEIRNKWLAQRAAQ